MDLVGALRAVDYIPVLQYLTATDIADLYTSTTFLHHELSQKAAPFWQRLAASSGYPYRLAGGPQSGPGPYLSATLALRLRFLGHPPRNFAVAAGARFRDLIGPALNCIRRRGGGVMFVVRAGGPAGGYGRRMRPVRDDRVRIGAVAAPGDLVQVLPTSGAFLVYDRGPDRGSADPVVEIGDAFAPAPPAVLAPAADRMAALFPLLVRYLQSGRVWSILFSDPDGMPSRPIQLICSSRADRRRAFEMRAAYRTNMAPTFDVLENYLRRKAGEPPRPCPDLELYPGLRPAMDPDTLVTSNYVHFWWSYGLYWFQMSLSPVNRPDWTFPIASFPTLHDLFSQLEQLRVVHSGKP